MAFFISSLNPIGGWLSSQYCTRRIRRVSKSVGFTHGKHAYKAKVTNGEGSERGAEIIGRLTNVSLLGTGGKTRGRASMVVHPLILGRASMELWHAGTTLTDHSTMEFIFGGGRGPRGEGWMMADPFMYPAVEARAQGWRPSSVSLSFGEAF